MRVYIDISVNSHSREYRVNVLPFGDSVTLIPSDPSDPRLTINVNDLRNAQSAVQEAQ